MNILSGFSFYLLLLSSSLVFYEVLRREKNDISRDKSESNAAGNREFDRSIGFCNLSRSMVFILPPFFSFCPSDFASNSSNLLFCHDSMLHDDRDTCEEHRIGF